MQNIPLGNWSSLTHHVVQATPLNEALFMALLFSMIRIPAPDSRHASTNTETAAGGDAAGSTLREKGNVRFSDEQGLNDQL